MPMSPHIIDFGFCVGRSKAFKAARKRDMAFLSSATLNTDFLAVSLSRVMAYSMKPFVQCYKYPVPAIVLS